MRKTYIIAVQFTSNTAELAMKTLMSGYSSHFVLSQNCWLVVAGGTAKEMRDNIQNKIGNDATVFVAGLGAAISWSEEPRTLASWLPRQLAST